MANCAKCGAELIGSGKFCASCGAPAAAAAPSSPATSSEIGPAAPSSPATSSEIGPATPVSGSKVLSTAGEADGADGPIDPLATTASPSSVAVSSAPLPSPVSPLARSNIERETFGQIIGSAAREIEQRPPSVAPAPPARPKKAGTQLMPNAPAWWRAEPDEAARRPRSDAPAPPKKAAPRTMAIAHPPNLGAPAASPQSAPIAPQNAARSLPTPQALQPAPVGPYPGQPPAGPAGWGPRAPAAPPPYPYPAPFGYAPGARVQVTWSNGQRYPATVTQVSGAQCLVVFPDGQQHWIDAQYLSPA